ncbi:MAG: putative porin [Bacteroidota bacterium]
MKFIIRIYALVVLLLFVAALVYAQPTERKTPLIFRQTYKVDSTNHGVISEPQKPPSFVDTQKKRIDTASLAHADSTIIDSIRIRFIPGMGQIISEVDTTNVLHQKQFLWSDAKNISDLLWKLPGFFYRDLGEAGKWGELNAFGVDGRGIGILLDGRPMNDPVTGTYNLSDLPLEFIDHTEILSGSTSILASGDDGTALNFVSRSYNSYRPLTKLRFVQEPNGTILTDGLFTQNVARGLNLMIGFQRTTTVGRYANAALDAWNVRTRLRYNFSDRLNIALTDFYTKAGNGLNGGVDPSQSASFFDETSAIVFNQYAHDERSRRDVTLSAIARIFSDSSSTTQASFYYSTLEREYWNPPDYQNGHYQNIDDSTKASFWGVRLQQQLSFRPVHLTVGGNWERRQSDSTRTLPSHIESKNSLFAQAELRLINIFVPSVSLCSTSLDGESNVSSSVGAKSVLADWLTLFIDASRYDRFPTIQERYWRDSTVVRTNEIAKEQNTFLQGGVNINAGSDLQLSLTGFQRTVKNAIVFQPAVTLYGSPAIGISNINEVKSLGLNGRVVFYWHQFEVFGVMTLTRYTQAETLKTLTPDVILAGEVSYRDKFFKEKLDAKFGIRSRFYNREQEGMQFDPQMLSYVQYENNLIGRSTTIDLFMILKIGDAHISLSWNNILNAGYFLSPIYPVPGSNIRLGVNWVFLD